MKSAGVGASYKNAVIRLQNFAKFTTNQDIQVSLEFINLPTMTTTLKTVFFKVNVYDQVNITSNYKKYTYTFNNLFDLNAGTLTAPTSALKTFTDDSANYFGTTKSWVGSITSSAYTVKDYIVI